MPDEAPKPSAPPSPFVHLRLHTEYSLEDGMVRIGELVERAAELGMPAVAVTDWHNLFGLVKFYRAAIAKGIKPIIGADVRVQDAGDAEQFGVVTLLVQDRTGYLNLCRILSRSFLEGRFRGHPRVHPAWLRGHTDGLIALVGRQSNVGEALSNGRTNLARNRLEEWETLFPDRLYLTLERMGRDNERVIESGLLDLAVQRGLPVVASNDVRFLTRDEFFAHEARVCINQGRLLDDKRRPREYVDEQYLKSGEEMAEQFADLPVALENTLHLARRCNLELRLGEYFLPAFPVPDGETEDDFVRRKAAEGLDKRLNRHGLAGDVSREDYDQRLERELEVIVSMGFSGYFLIVADFIAWARNNGVPVGPGRGSGAGSVVAWCLGITDVDPMRYELLFERFLNPERVSMPDFDIDFCVEGRDRVIEYVAQRYGREQVSQIITYGTMAAKAVVRDCGRVLGYNYGFVDSIAKLIPNQLDMTLDKALAEEPELKARYEKEDDTRTVLDLARSLEGLARNAGKHAGGLVIAPGPLTDYTPLYTEPDGHSVLTQFDKNDVEEVGLVKFDFLGLRNLTIIDWALKAVNASREKTGEAPIDLDDVPLDDDKAFELLRAAHTTAVFQLESPGMKEMLRKLKPDSFNDIVAAVALYRPGPLDAGMVEEYIDRKHGKAPVRYPHPKAGPILEPTYGVILYQEQVMQIAQELAGYSLGGADLLRRAMGKKKVEEMERQREIFVTGASDNGIEASEAESIFNLMETFARYGFNKSHSVAYALVAYQTAWLKAHYPAEFMAAVLSADLDKTDKIANLIEDCRLMGLEILPPDINRSAYRFEVENGAIRYGLGALKGVGRSAVENLVDVRADCGGFTSLAHLCREADLSRLNRRTLETLIRSGAADCLHENRAALMQALPDILSEAERFQADREAGQSSLFGGASPQAETASEERPLPDVHDWTLRQRLRAEKETLGLYLSGHPMDELRDELADTTTTTLEGIEGLLGHGGGEGGRRGKGKPMTLAGLISAIRRRPGKGAFIALDDGTARLEVAIFDRLFQQISDRLIADEIVVVRGRVEIDTFRGGYRMVAEEVMSVDEARSQFARRVEIEINQPQKSLEHDLAAALQPYRPGRTPVVVQYRNHSAQAVLHLGTQWHVTPSTELLAALRGVSGIGAVKLKY
ncbi:MULTISPECIES: DNA polymerase III subunit alpha [unclassified Wenzhouxiangella]|uniref:DNA polymerase III subunit alpha n=1 Tax=unclassified Wenzhouxiangella TaxID=2613841 RepID=UPI000E3276CF|nr:MULTISPECIES: DNA polymerase III subunit alpha [unclassified Wenzhouxiangella]RFF28306.1 DNA polymerase III subunit alpha [Wenzhouxiangella sp. 15181]RFP67769.1 DNA polymerase III subunit alpha [Wenzhouxiangella sp. 15190]